MAKESRYANNFIGSTENAISVIFAIIETGIRFADKENFAYY